MKNTFVTTAAALLLAAASVGLAIAPAAAATSVTTTVTKPAIVKVVARHPAHWHMHRVCKTNWDHHHHKVKVCTWVKNK